MAERGKKPNQLVAVANDKSQFLQPSFHSTPAYKAVWSSVVEDFPADYFRPSDVHALDMFVKLTLQYAKMHKQVEEEGYTVEDRWGGTKSHPLLQSIGMVTQRLNALRASLRIQPSSRYDDTFNPDTPLQVGGIRADEDEDDDGWTPPLAGSK